MLVLKEKKRSFPQLHRAAATAADDGDDLHSVDADADEDAEHEALPEELSPPSDSLTDLSMEFWVGASSCPCCSRTAGAFPQSSWSPRSRASHGPCGGPHASPPNLRAALVRAHPACRSGTPACHQQIMMARQPACRRDPGVRRTMQNTRLSPTSSLHPLTDQTRRRPA